MIIKSIEIENFLSYYGKHELIFDEGPTIIIGQNNTGKSKLFDAFNWVLYDKAFNTEQEMWYETKDWQDGLFNRKAKLESKVGDSISTSVSLIFYDEEENKYLLVREYEIKNKNNNWECQGRSNLYLTISEAVTNNTIDYFDEEAIEKIKGIFPTNLSKYFLFQGESISQIMNLSSRSAFNNALRDLSRIEVFEKAKIYTNKAYKKIKKEFDYKEDSDKALQEKKVLLSKNIDNIKDNIEAIKVESETLVKERETAKDIFDKKDNEIKKYEECNLILKDIEILEKQLRDKNEHRLSEVENQKKYIFDGWMYAGSKEIFENFLSFYKKNKKEKRIPEPIRQDFIREMLADEACKVCGSPAPSGSAQYKQIKSQLNDKSLDEEIEIINNLSYVADSALNKINGISEEITEYHTRVNKINDSINKIKSQLRIKEEELRTVIPKDISTDELKVKDFTDIQTTRDRLKNEIEKFNNKILTCKIKIENKEKELEEKEKEYDGLVAKSSNEKERARVMLAGKVNEIMSAFYDKFFDKLINEIQSNANNYFTKMTEMSKAISGNVKVDSELNEIYTIDENGNRMYNINQANKVSLQISFVAAVLSVSNNFWETYFPFIADAPISALGGNNKITAINTMIEIFSQSIIILKDDAVTGDQDSIKKDLTRKLIHSNKKIKNAYELVMDGDSLENQHTKIIKIK